MKYIAPNTEPSFNSEKSIRESAKEDDLASEHKDSTTVAHG